MEEQRIEKIRFSIKGPEGLYRGEATGCPLREQEVYDVQLSSGDRFQVKAVPEAPVFNARYKWVPITKDKISRLAPIVGTIIERYFRRKKQVT